jgi:acyl-CoA synthetase (AMP-forming)/AMP-acid ligase II
MINITYKTLCEAFLDMHNYNETHTFIENADNEINITSEDLKSRVLKILHYMQYIGVKPGDEVVFQIKSNIDFVHVFWACLLGRIIPVPYTYLESERDKLKLLKIWNNLKNPFLATDIDSFEKLKKFIYKNDLSFKLQGIINKVIITEEMEKLDENVEIILPNESDIAFVQFSSGSTNDPKGVIITHKNIITSVREAVKAMKISEEDIYLSWLPLTHSFGLIGTYITPFLARLKYYIMPSNLFVTYPLLWVKKMSEHNVTITAAPNFALKHVCKYISIEKDIDMDLSALRIIIDGAEPVSPDTCREFNEKMYDFGMKNTTVRPSYGLSEATLVVTTPKCPQEFREVNVMRNHVKIGEKIIESDIKNDNVISFVEVGACIGNCEIKIINDDGEKVGDRVVGSVLLRGDMISTGYYNNPEATKNSMDKYGWYNTGDLGFLRDGNLVLTGRVKDVIFVKGENYYSHDIENICQQVNDAKFSRVAVCGVYNHKMKQDQVICFLEYDGDVEMFNDISLGIKRHVIKKIGIGISHVIPIKKIPVTVSGKMKRYILSQQFMKGDFDETIQKILS